MNVCDAQEHATREAYLACPICHPAEETPRDVVLALVEAYRQAKQDLIHAQWGDAWPRYQRQEAQALRELERECAGWVERWTAARAFWVLHTTAGVGSGSRPVADGGLEGME
jgi:hypothetical protein